MKILKKGVVYSASPGSHLPSCTFPQVCAFPDGRWLCAFRRAPSKSATTGQRPSLVFSEDQGKNWSAPVDPFTPPEIQGRPGLFRTAGVTPLGADGVLASLSWVDHSDPALPFFNETTEGLLDTRIFLAWSTNKGRTWSAPKRMKTDPFHVPTPLTGPVLVWPNGEWACQFEVNKPYDETAPWQHRSVLMFSHDQGESWKDFAYTSPDGKIFYWDQRPAIVANDRLLNVFWTFDTRINQYLNIHASESRDQGRTWSDLWDTGIPGQPAPPVPMGKSRIGMVYVDRTDIPTIKFRLSSDWGRNWPAETEVILHTAMQSQNVDRGDMKDAWAEMAAFSLGLPATAPLPGDKILVVYYSGPQTDQTDIWFAVIGE